MIQLAKVTSVSPLEVRPKTAPDGSSTAVDWVDRSVAEVALGDDVLVDTFDRKVALLHRLSTDVGWARRTIVKAVQVDYALQTALADDAELQFAVAADAQYLVTGRLRLQGPTGGDAKLAWTYPTGAAIVWSVGGPDVAAASNIAAINLRAYSTADEVQVGLLGTTSTQRLFIPIHALIDTAGTAGTVALRHAQATSNATATSVLTLSSMQVERVG